MKNLKLPYDPKKTTVQVAEDWVMNNAAEGVECPCCGQTAKLYRRKLYSSMAYALILINGANVPEDCDGWLHVPNLLNGHGTVARGGDFAKLVHWGLLEGSEKASGHYRITTKGRDFVQCRIVVPEAVFIYDGQCIGDDQDKMVTISEVLGKRFDYEELMKKAV